MGWKWMCVYIYIPPNVNFYGEIMINHWIWGFPWVFPNQISPNLTVPGTGHIGYRQQLLLDRHLATTRCGSLRQRRRRTSVRRIAWGCPSELIAWGGSIYGDTPILGNLHIYNWYIHIYICVYVCVYIYMYITIVNGFCKPTWNWGGLALQHFVEKYSYQLSSYHPETRGCFMGI